MEGYGSEAMYLDYNSEFNSLNWFFVTDIDNTTVSSNQAVMRRGFGGDSLGGTLRYTVNGLGGFYQFASGGVAISNLTSILNPSVNEVLMDYNGTQTAVSAYQDANIFSGPYNGNGILTNQTSTVKPVIGGAYQSNSWNQGDHFSDFFRGRIGEIIWINDSVVTTDTRQKIQGYLAWKWGTEGNLPVGHPYKDNPPTI